MEQTRTTSAARRLTLISLVTVALLTGCASQLTESGPVAVDPSAGPTTSTTVIPLEVDPRPTAVSQEDDQSADPTDPAAVARALVMVVANRHHGEPLEAWRDRAARWATPTVVAGLDDQSSASKLGSDLDARAGDPVGIVVGTAVASCAAAHCRVLVVANESVLIAGRLLDEQNFVTWQLDVIESDAHQWMVDSVQFGAGS